MDIVKWWSKHGNGLLPTGLPRLFSNFVARGRRGFVLLSVLLGERICFFLFNISIFSRFKQSLIFFIFYFIHMYILKRFNQIFDLNTFDNKTVYLFICGPPGTGCFPSSHG